MFGSETPWIYPCCVEWRLSAVGGMVKRSIELGPCVCQSRMSSSAVWTRCINKLTRLLSQLEADPETGKLTGRLLSEVEHPIISPSRKRFHLLDLATRHNVPLSQTLAVGDGANDLLMLHAAAVGIAFNAKPKVQMEAPMALNGETLTEVLPLIGLKEEEIQILTAAESSPDQFSSLSLNFSLSSANMAS